MLKKILSVSGKSGLFKLISTGKNINVVESLSDGKKIPVYMNEKVVSLGDVSIYTEENDIPLSEVLKKIKEKESGNKVKLTSKSSNKEVFDYFAEILPDYNQEKVYASDVKKVLNWYNLLIDHNIDFEIEEETSGESNEAQEDVKNE